MSLNTNHARSDESYALIALNQVQGMDPHVLFKMIEVFGSPLKAWRAPNRDIENAGLLNNFTFEKFLDLRKIEDGVQEEDRAAELGVDVFTIRDASFPKKLADIPIPPPVIYVRGNINEKDARAIAIVGTRRCNGYGRKVAADFATDFTAAGCTVVSGLAYGIDTVAHEAALAAGGRTISVKAVGIDVDYPAGNLSLVEKISSSGAVVSEFPLGMKIQNKWQFRRRNRIISGLAEATVVVQSSRQGGALITAAHAEEQGKEVFAVPGDVNSPLSGGCHWLIRNGAHIAESAQDVLEGIGIGTQVELDLSAMPELEGLQKEIYEIMSDGPIQFGEICAATGKAAAEISSALLLLEMKGRVKQMPGKMYSRD